MLCDDNAEQLEAEKLQKEIADMEQLEAQRETETKTAVNMATMDSKQKIPRAMRISKVSTPRNKSVVNDDCEFEDMDRAIG